MTAKSAAVPRKSAVLAMATTRVRSRRERDDRIGRTPLASDETAHASDERGAEQQQRSARESQA